MGCQCLQNKIIDISGLCDSEQLQFAKVGDPNYLIDRNWTEISIPELLTVPCEKPPIENINKVLASIKIISKRVIQTPTSQRTGSENEEGTKLTGYKLVVEGILEQKVVYTADVPQQSVHSVHFEVPFSVFIVLTPLSNPADTLNTKYCVDACIEDIYVKAFNTKDIFKNVTLFLRARPAIC